MSEDPQHARAGAGAAEILPAIQINDTDKYTCLDTPEIKALFLQHGQTAVCLLSADLCVLNRVQAAAVRRAAAEALSLPQEAVHIGVTHTHAPGAGAGCPIHLGRLSAAAAAAARQARQQSRPAAQVGYLSVDTGGRFNINRRTRTGNLGVWCLMQSAGCKDDGHAVDGAQWVRDKMQQGGANAAELDLIEGPFLADRPADTRLDLLLLEDAAGKPIAGLARFAAHAVICSTGYWKPNISRDYPGALCDTLSAALGCPILFAQGPSADQRPRHRDVGTEECARIGRGLSGALLDNLTSMRRWPFDRLHCIQREITAAVRTEVPLTAAEAEPHWQESSRKLAAAGHNSVIALLERKRLLEREKFHQKLARLPFFLDYLAPEERRTLQARLSVSLVQIGTIRLLLFPGELAATAVQDMAAPEGAPVIVTSYTDGVAGYLLPPADFAEGGYETTSALLAPETALQLRAAGLHLLKHAL